MSNFYNEKRIWKEGVDADTLTGITNSRIKNTYIQHLFPNRYDIDEVQMISMESQTNGQGANEVSGSNTIIFLTSKTTPGWEYIKLRPNLLLEDCFRITNSIYSSQQKYFLPSRIDYNHKLNNSNIIFGANIFMNGPMGPRDYPLLFSIHPNYKLSGIPRYLANAFMTVGSGSPTIPNLITHVQNDPGYGYGIFHSDNGLSAMYIGNGMRTPFSGSASANAYNWYTNYVTDIRGSGSGMRDDGTEKFIFDNLSRNNTASPGSVHRGVYFVCGTINKKIADHFKIIPYGNVRAGFRDESNASAAIATSHAVQVFDSRGSTFNRDHIFTDQGFTSLSPSQGNRWSLMISASVILNGGVHYNITRFNGNAVPRHTNFSNDVSVFNNGNKCNLWVRGFGAGGRHTTWGPGYSNEIPLLVFGEIEYEPNKSDVFIARHGQQVGDLLNFNIIASRPTENINGFFPRWTIVCARNNPTIGANTAYISSTVNNTYTYLDMKFIIYDKSGVIPGMFLFSASNLLITTPTIFSDRAGPSTKLFCTPNEIIGSDPSIKYKAGANVFQVENVLPYAGPMIVPHMTGVENRYTVEITNSSYYTVTNDIQSQHTDANLYTSTSLIVNSYFTFTDIKSQFSRNRIY
jgi:hypothetical protein